MSAQNKTQHFLLLTPGLELESNDAIDHMYNFKFDQAQAEFIKIRNRHPEHPLPYFLLAMNNWWKMFPYMEYETNVRDPWAAEMLAYLDTAIAKAEVFYEIDSVEVEAAFFLSAAYGIKARYHAEQNDKLAAVMPSKHCLKYFKRTEEENEISPEFLFGSALMNYYGEWFREEYPGLKPVLMLFPKGNKTKGIEQMERCARTAYYTRTEASYFLYRIYRSEGQESKADEIIKNLHESYPDNAYFERMYSRTLLFSGRWHDCEQTCKTINYKFEIKMPGYEENSARYANYFLGHIYRHGYKDKTQAKEYYLKSILYAEKTDATKMSYYLTAVTEMARMAIEDNDVTSARAYYKTVKDNASKKDEDTGALWKEADAYLKKTKKQAKKGK